MKKYKNILGLAMVVTGAIILIISAILNLTNINIIQFVGFIFILAGIITYVIMLKRISKY